MKTLKSKAMNDGKRGGCWTGRHEGTGKPGETWQARHGIKKPGRDMRRRPSGTNRRSPSRGQSPCDSRLIAGQQQVEAASRG